ncbi:hypothetical protein TNCV_2982951 [Trichonephila clavipes]|nr:hypothetical protein TNCV_2982951 [Trichonephila clavipes]
MAAPVSCFRISGTGGMVSKTANNDGSESKKRKIESILALIDEHECTPEEESHKVTVNGDRYRAMITNFFIPELNKHDILELWFQQDGATCHTARATIDLLKDTFGDA